MEVNKGGRWKDGADSGERELKIMIGPAVSLRARHQTDLCNAKSADRDTVKLIFAPAAASIIFEDEPSEDVGDDLVNDGYDPNEARVPAGQPGGGRWTTGGATNVVGTVFGGPYDIDPITRKPNVSGYTLKTVDPSQPGVALPHVFPHDSVRLPGVWVKISTIGNASSLCSAMNNRGISGK